MGIFSAFYPDEYLDSAYDIDYEAMHDKGIRGVIFDIDNTLVEHGAPANERAKLLFKRLSDIGIKTVVLSNNKRPRVESFAKSAGAQVMYIHKAGKPLPKGYVKAMDMMGCDSDNALFVGDQLFTDVWGAKRLKIYTILTKPIDPHEEIQIVLKRYLEKIVLYFYRREHGN